MNIKMFAFQMFLHEEKVGFRKVVYYIFMKCKAYKACLINISSFEVVLLPCNT